MQVPLVATTSASLSKQLKGGTKAMHVHTKYLEVNRGIYSKSFQYVCLLQRKLNAVVGEGLSNRFKPLID